MACSGSQLAGSSCQASARLPTCVLEGKQPAVSETLSSTPARCSRLMPPVPGYTGEGWRAGAPPSSSAASSRSRLSIGARAASQLRAAWTALASRRPASATNAASQPAAIASCIQLSASEFV